MMMMMIKRDRSNYFLSCSSAPGFVKQCHGQPLLRQYHARKPHEPTLEQRQRILAVGGLAAVTDSRVTDFGRIGDLTSLTAVGVLITAKRWSQIRNKVANVFQKGKK